MASRIPKGFRGTRPSWNAGVWAGGARNHLAPYVRSQGRPGQNPPETPDSMSLFLIFPLDFSQISRWEQTRTPRSRAGTEMPGTGLSRWGLTQVVGHHSPPKPRSLPRSGLRDRGAGREGRSRWRSWATEHRGRERHRGLPWAHSPGAPGGLRELQPQFPPGWNYRDTNPNRLPNLHCLRAGRVSCGTDPARSRSPKAGGDKARAAPGAGNAAIPAFHTVELSQVPLSLRCERG